MRRRVAGGDIAGGGASGGVAGSAGRGIAGGRNAKAAAINVQHRFHNRSACLRVFRHAGLSSKAWLLVCGHTKRKCA